MKSDYYAYIAYRKEVNRVTDLVAEFGRGFGKRYHDMAKVYGTGYLVSTISLPTVKVWDTLVEECKAKNLILGERRGTYLVNVPLGHHPTMDSIMESYKKQIDEIHQVMAKNGSLWRGSVPPKTRERKPKEVTMASSSWYDLKTMLSYETLEQGSEARITMEAKAKVWKDILELAQAKWEGTRLTLTFKGALYREESWKELFTRMVALWPQESKNLKEWKNLASLHRWLQVVMLFPRGALSHQDGTPPIHTLDFDMTSWPGLTLESKDVSWASL